MENKDKKDHRLFGLSTFSVDNATSIFLLAFIILIFGVQSYDTLPKESFPEVPWPKVYINTVYFGNSATDMENLVSKPIEKELSTISELKTVTSSSLQDFSLIVAEFNEDVDIESATRKVKDAVDRAKPELPNDLTSEPEVLEINMSEIPIMTVNLSGNFSNDQLRNYAEYLQDKIEELNEISSVDLKGDLDREVAIDVNLAKMESLEISFGDIENAIRAENVTMSGGELVTNDFRRTIRIVGEFTNVTQIEDLIVKSENQMPVFLKDIAQVRFDYADRTSIARAGGQPVISLDVIKRAGENLLSASDNIKAIVAEAKVDAFPEDLRVQIFNDQSVQTRNMVSNLENSIISGILLVVLVLLFFLGTRNSLFVGLAIPMSMLLGFIVIKMLGYTLNMVILFALILALGMLVDNAIVVIENIYRYMQEGYSRKEAAKYGTGEVAVPIISSTATTLAAFIPLAFWPGLMGTFMQYLPITLIITLTSSLFVALVINPVFASRFMVISKEVTEKSAQRRKRRNVFLGAGIMLAASVAFHFTGIQWLRNSLWVVTGISLLNYFVFTPGSHWFARVVLPWLERTYDNFILFSLKGKNPGYFFGGTFLLLIFSLVLLGLRSPKVKLFPTPDPNYVNAFIELPIGTDINATDSLMRKIETRVNEVILPYNGIVEAVLDQIGENTADPRGTPDFSASPHKARLTVSFIPSEDRGDVSSREVMEKIREGLEGYAGVQIVVDRNQAGPPTGKPINIELRGEDINTLALLAQEVMDYINERNIQGIEELKKDVSIGKPELIVNIDREAARRYGISTYLIADAIRTAVFGKEVSKFKQNDDEFPIQIRVDKESRYNIDDILNQSITFRSPSNGRISQVPISSVANISYSSTFTSINRKDQERMITISSNVLDGYVPNEVVAEVKSTLANFNFPNNYTYEFTGEQKDQADNMAFLKTAFTVAIFAIFLIIVAQFNSVISPFIIMLQVLFSTIGVFLGYVVNGMDILIVMTGVGIISLAGVAVNNGIVLIDYTNLLIRRKMEKLGVDSQFKLPLDEVKDAVMQGGGTRLRPVLLTAITTVLGLIPLAIGFNFNFFTFITDLDPNMYVGGDSAAFWGTLAWTVIYGLMFATFLTLVIVPVMYWLAFLMQRWVIGFFKKEEEPIPATQV
ncbi:MAG: efflux RND transporter permease subunit [Saprospirales bacterium]|nr:efflux RND transporter permease subunit [Saprospirales bacterium]